MFGDPIKNEKRWAQLTLNSVCDGIGDGLHGTPEYDDSGDFYFINGNNLINGEIVITPSTKKVNEEVFKKYYRNISSNALLLSINGTLGKIAFYNNEAITLGKSACYINLKTFVNKYFVFELMKTDHFLKYLEENSTKSTIKNVSLKTIRNFQLISPPENLQNDFISFSKKIDKSKFLLQQILKKLELLKKSRFIEMFGRLGCDDKKWGLVSLGEFCLLNPQKSELHNISDDTEVSFLPMSSVSENGELTLSERKLYRDVKSGFSYFAEGDVLFAKITPCMENGKGAVAHGLCNNIGFGSTEFHVLRAKTSVCNPYWLYELLSLKQFRKIAEQNMTGSAGQKRVPAKFLQNFKLSLPHIELQNEYVSISRQIDKSKLIIQKALEDLVGKV